MRGRVLALLLLAVSCDAAALSCIIPPVAKRYEASEHVALVEVTEARVEHPEGYSPDIPGQEPQIVVTAERHKRSGSPRIVATILVIESYKGEDTPTQLVVTDWAGSPELSVGARYLVYLDGPEVSLDCDGMTKISGEEQGQIHVLSELRELNQRTPN